MKTGGRRSFLDFCRYLDGFYIQSANSAVGVSLYKCLLVYAYIYTSVTPVMIMFLATFLSFIWCFVSELSFMLA